MKSKYTAPEAEILVFESEDIITTSMVGNGIQSEIDELDGLGEY